MHVTFEISGSPGGAIVSTNATTTAAAGNSFFVTLDSNPETGYQWQVKTIGRSIAKLVMDEYVPAFSGMLGASGKQVMTFQAMKAGYTIIELVYVRPWEPDNPVKAYSIDVVARSWVMHSVYACIHDSTYATSVPKVQSKVNWN